jgi:hypothetical protein
MTDSLELKKLISKSGYKLRWIANQINISYQAFYNKLNDKTEFLPSEIAALQQILKFSDKTRDKIFFSQKVYK